MVVVGPPTLEHKVKGSNPATASNGREDHITKNQTNILATDGDTVVRLLTLDHKGKSLIPIAAVTRREEHITKI
jgi:hypothetical protein